MPKSKPHGNKEISFKVIEGGEMQSEELDQLIAILFHLWREEFEGTNLSHQGTTSEFVKSTEGQIYQKNAKITGSNHGENE